MADTPIARLVGAAKGSRRFIEREIARIVGLNRDARELFLDEEGKMRPAAERLLGRLAAHARLNAIGFDPDARHQDYMAGQRDMVRFLGKMLELDVRRLEELQRKLGE